MAKRLRSSMIVLAVFAIGAFATASATAATTIGDACVANAAGAGTRVQTGTPATVGLYTVPSAGVITKWGTSVISYPGGIAAKLKLVRPGLAPNTYDVVGETAGAESVIGGVNSFNTRISVTGGEQVAMFSAVGALFCNGIAGDGSAQATTPGDPAVGSNFAVAPANANTRLAVTATIEADADGDGFGDESQDACPESKIFSTACPKVTLAKRVLAPTKKLIEVLLTSNTPSAVTVSGSVPIKLPKSKKTTTFKLAAVTQTISPGELASIKAKYPKKLVSALKKFPKSKKFKLKLTVSGVGVINTDTTVTTVTIRGTK